MLFPVGSSLCHPDVIQYLCGPASTLVSGLGFIRSFFAASDAAVETVPFSKLSPLCVVFTVLTVLDLEPSLADAKWRFRGNGFLNIPPVCSFDVNPPCKPFLSFAVVAPAAVLMSESIRGVVDDSMVVGNKDVVSLMVIGVQPSTGRLVSGLSLGTGVSVGIVALVIFSNGLLYESILGYC